MADQFHWVMVGGRREKRQGPRPVHVYTFLDWKRGMERKTWMGEPFAHKRWGKVIRVSKEIETLDIEQAERAWLHLEETLKYHTERLSKHLALIARNKRLFRGKDKPIILALSVRQSAHYRATVKRIKKIQKLLILVDGRIFHLRARANP